MYNQRQCFATAHIKLVVYFFVILIIATMVIIITTFIFTTLSLISLASLLLGHP